MTETQRQNTQGILHGERVYLRPPTMQDARYVFHWERDDEVWRYDPGRPYSKTMTEFLPTFERNYVQGNGRQFWYIIEDEHHVPIGTITYFNIDNRTGQAEVGLGLGDKTRWGKGYGPAAIRTLENDLGARGRVLVRYSGTEAKLRLLVEGPTEAVVRDGLARLESSAREG